MHLIGTGLADRVIGNSSLGELLVGFADIKPTPADQETLIPKQRAIEKSMRELTAALVPPFQKTENEKRVATLGVEYICSAFGMRYTTLSPDLFHLRRVETVRIEGKPYTVELPLFAHAPVSSEKGVWEHEHVTAEDGATGRRFQYKVNISAKMPSIPQAVLQEVREARSLYHAVVSRALKRPVLGNLLSSWLDSGHRSVFGESIYFATNVYWIPRPEELKLESTKIDKDPFVAVQLHDRFYLIPSNWEIREEFPFQHYLDEFSEKKAVQNWRRRLDKLKGRA